MSQLIDPKEKKKWPKLQLQNNFPVYNKVIFADLINNQVGCDAKFTRKFRILSVLIINFVALVVESISFYLDIGQVEQAILGRTLIKSLCQKPVCMYNCFYVLFCLFFRFSVHFTNKFRNVLYNTDKLHLYTVQLFTAYFNEHSKKVTDI